MADTIISIGELSVAQGEHSLTTLGLGSCVGLVLYDRLKKIGGMAHVMLPKAPENASLRHPKYADVAFGMLLQKMTAAGANMRGLTAKMVGGAHMFSSAMDSDIMKVGQRNVEIVHQLLHAQGIPVIAEETGGTVGRTIILDCATGDLLVRTAYPRMERII